MFVNVNTGSVSTQSIGTAYNWAEPRAVDGISYAFPTTATGSMLGFTPSLSLPILLPSYSFNNRAVVSDGRIWTAIAGGRTAFVLDRTTINSTTTVTIPEAPYGVDSYDLNRVVLGSRNGNAMFVNVNTGSVSTVPVALRDWGQPRTFDGQVLTLNTTGDQLLVYDPSGAIEFTMTHTGWADRMVRADGRPWAAESGGIRIGWTTELPRRKGFRNVGLVRGARG